VAGKWINAHGGINKHSSPVTVCDDQGQPTQASACARPAVLVIEQHVRKAPKYAADRVYVMRRGRLEMSLTASDALARISEIEQSYLSKTALPLPALDVGNPEPDTRA